MDTPKIELVMPLAGRRLLVLFANGVRKIYDCENLNGLDRFRLLKDEALAIRVDTGGYGIAWDDETDLSEYELWVRSVEPEVSMPECMERVAQASNSG